MFDFFRNNIKFLMGLLMLLIIPSFVLFGIEGYTNLRENQDVVARVGKTEITRQEWDNTHRNEIDRMLANLPTLDRSLVDTEESRYATLERMVNDRALALAAQEGHFVTTDQRLARELSEDPNIAALRRADGTLDVAAYQRLLAAQGMSPEMFENSVRADLARRQVALGIAASGFVTAGAAQPALQSFFERREVQVARFVPADFRAAVQITDADVEAYYHANPGLFQSPEQVDIEYLVLDLEAVARDIQISEADLRAYHEQNSAALDSQEQRRASHILLTVPAGASDGDKAEVRQKAQALLDQLRQSPDRFAELARAHSQDPGSAQQGGDLDFFARGAMVKPFEDATFSLSKGQISDLVESEFGFHIIQLTDVRRPPARPFEVARADLTAELRRQMAQRQFAEAAENFSNLVYEQADSLAPAAEQLKLTVRTQRNVLRSGPEAADAPAVLSSPRLLQSVFSDDAVRSKRNTEAVEAGPNQLVSARVLAHRPAATRPLPEVAPQARERLLRQRAIELAAAQGQARLNEWKGGASAAALPAPVVVSRDQPQGQPARVVTAALTADAAQLPAWVGVDLADGGYAVVRVNQVLERRSPPEAQAKQELDELGRLWTQAESQAFLKSLRARYKTQILAPKPAGVTG